MRLICKQFAGLRLQSAIGGLFFALKKLYLPPSERMQVLRRSGNLRLPPQGSGKARSALLPYRADLYSATARYAPHITRLDASRRGLKPRNCRRRYCRDPRVIVRTAPHLFTAWLCAIRPCSAHLAVLSHAFKEQNRPLYCGILARRIVWLCTRSFCTRGMPVHVCAVYFTRVREYQ